MYEMKSELYMFFHGMINRNFAKYIARQLLKFKIL